MDVAERLDAMRAEVNGCSLVAFADLGSKLVLCVSAAIKPAQEEMDRLSSLAELVLNGALASGAAPVLTDGEGDGRAGMAMLMSGSEAKVFLRAQGAANEALVCVCAPETDIGKVVDCGRSTLDGIVSAS